MKLCTRRTLCAFEILDFLKLRRPCVLSYLFSTACQVSYKYKIIEKANLSVLNVYVLHLPIYSELQAMSLCLDASGRESDYVA